MIEIQTSDLVPLNAFENEFPIKIDMVYANQNHPDNHFINLYNPNAQILWTHKDLGIITLVAAKVCFEKHGWIFEIKDSLRPIEAQEGMAHYGYDPSLVLPPGKGGHPRAMAIDIQPFDTISQSYVEMGTDFDYFAKNPEIENMAARNCTDFGGNDQQNNIILQNRTILDDAMHIAASLIKIPFLPFPPEWWDYRFAPKYFEMFAPLSESNLQPYQRLIKPDIIAIEAILNKDYPDEVDQTVNEVRKSTINLIDVLSLQNIINVNMPQP